MRRDPQLGLTADVLAQDARRAFRERCSLLFALLVVAGCSADVSRPTPPGSGQRSLRPVQNLQMLPSREELALVEQIRNIYPGPEADSLIAYLGNPTVVGVQSSNPRVQAILDRLDAVRRPRLDSARRAAAAAAALRPKTVAVTIAIVDSIGDSTVTAVVVRRLNRQPRELVLLTPATASPGVLGAALHALVRLRSLDGDSAKKDKKIVVHGALVPAAWTPARVQMTEALLSQVRRMPLSQIVGVGRARALEIGLSAAQ